MNKQALRWIKKLGLEPHPEGGYYRETYRAEGVIPEKVLRPQFSGSRSFSTAIYFLLSDSQCSKLHRIRSDEIWHFYAGTALVLSLINSKGKLQQINLGFNPDGSEVPQAVIPAGCWFGAKLANPGSYALVGCTVAPGFDFREFELGDRFVLLDQYPKLASLIEELT